MILDSIPKSAPGRNRTGDLALRRHSLYPLSYRGGKERPETDNRPHRWWRRRGSNPRPSHCERDALPTELLPLSGRRIVAAKAELCQKSAHRSAKTRYDGSKEVLRDVEDRGAGARIHATGRHRQGSIAHGFSELRRHRPVFLPRRFYTRRHPPSLRSARP